MRQKSSENIIDKIWELNSSLAQVDIEMYDILEVDKETYEKLIIEYTNLFNKKATKKALEKYFGLIIIVHNVVIGGFKLEKDI